MPIVRTYGDVGVFGQGAYDAGVMLGRNRREARQRELDARFLENRLAARERITEIQTRANYASQAQQQPQRQSGPSTVINDFARRMMDEQDAQSRQIAAQSAKLAERNVLASSLEDAYSDREKDFTYFYAQDLLRKGKPIPDRIMAAIGIQEAGEDEATARREAEIQAGQIDSAEPKTDLDRLVRRSLEQGRPGDIAGLLDKVDKLSTSDLLSGAVAGLSREALAARTQLEGFAGVTTDKEMLIKYRDELKSDGVSPEALQALDDRIIELEQDEMEIKAPAAFEQVVNTFQSKLDSMQKVQGKQLDVTERRKLMSKTLRQTAESYGISVELLGDYIRANDENRRMAEMLVQRAQDAIRDMQDGAGNMTGTEEHFGPNDTDAPNRLPSQAQDSMIQIRDLNLPRTTQ